MFSRLSTVPRVYFFYGLAAAPLASGWARGIAWRSLWFASWRVWRSPRGVPAWPAWRVTDGDERRLGRIGPRGGGETDRWPARYDSAHTEPRDRRYPARAPTCAVARRGGCRPPVLVDWFPASQLGSEGAAAARVRGSHHAHLLSLIAIGAADSRSAYAISEASEGVMATVARAAPGELPPWWSVQVIQSLCRAVLYLVESQRRRRLRALGHGRIHVSNIFYRLEWSRSSWRLPRPRAAVATMRRSRQSSACLSACCRQLPTCTAWPRCCVAPASRDARATELRSPDPSRASATVRAAPVPGGCTAACRRWPLSSRHRYRAWLLSARWWRATARRLVSIC